MRISVLLFVFILSAAKTYSQEPAIPPQASEAQQNYATEIADLEQTLDQTTSDASASYLKFLDGHIDTRQAAGDLDEVVALRAERQKAGKGDLSKSEKLPAAAARQKQQLEAAIRRAQLLFANKAKSTHGDFVRQLQELEKTETQAGHIDTALSIKKYRQSIEKSGPPAKTMGDVITNRSFSWRFGKEKERLLETEGGTKESELAVDLGLAWLARQQRPDGGWGVRASNPSTTSSVLEAYLGAGNTHRTGKYRSVVERGLGYLFANPEQNIADGKKRIVGHLVYCEAYGMTGDPELRRRAELVLASFTKAPVRDSGFDENSPLTLIAVYVNVLRAAKLAGLEYPSDVVTRAGNYLDVLSRDEKSSFVWNKAESNPVKAWYTPHGMVTRMLVNQWDAQHPAIQRAIPMVLESLSGPTASRRSDLLFLYSDGSEFFYAIGGPVWKEKWNPQVQERILQLQLPKGHPDAGAFVIPPDDPNAPLGNASLDMTCLLVKTLEVYYRYPRETYYGVR
ncbi:hypothetical protein GC163_03295 [bacterium]|nr:hypothetical protein [bacterium]